MRTLFIFRKKLPLSIHRENSPPKAARHLWRRSANLTHLSLRAMSLRAMPVGFLCFGKSHLLRRWSFTACLLLSLVFCAYGEKPDGASSGKETPWFGTSFFSKSVQKTPKTIAVPYLLGKTKEEAESDVTKLGLNFSSVQTSSGNGKPGTVVRQQPAAKTAVIPGSTVNLWILDSSASLPKQVQKDTPSLKPNIYAKQKSLFLEFPEEVANVVVLDGKGAVLQWFAAGRRFDITQSLLKTNAGRIHVAFERKGGAGTPPKSPVPLRGSIPPDSIPYELYKYSYLFSASVTLTDRSTIENNEPANNTINGAPLLSAGQCYGEIGDGDTTDYCKVTSGPSGFGSLIRVEVKSGAVTLHLYDPTKTYLDGNASKIWIALRPNTTFYFQVSHTGGAAGTYHLTISKNTLTDNYESNDSFAQAKTFGAGRAFLANVIDNAGLHVGIKDYYKFNVPEPQNLRLEVTNAGLASGDQVTLSLYDANGTHVTSNNGNTAGCVLTHDLRPAWAGVDWPPFPAGDWRVEVSTPTAGAGSPEAYGTGDAPSCYTQVPGYTLAVSVLP